MKPYCRQRVGQGLAEETRLIFCFWLLHTALFQAELWADTLWEAQACSFNMCTFLGSGDIKYERLFHYSQIKNKKAAKTRC